MHSGQNTKLETRTATNFTNLSNSAAQSGCPQRTRTKNLERETQHTDETRNIKRETVISP